MNKGAGGLDRQVTRLVVKVVARLLKKQAAECFKRGKEICKRVKHHEELLDIIARQVASQAKRGE